MNWLTRIATNDLPFASVDASGRRFETGVPVEFKYVRNNQKAPDLGSKYQQDIEPAGRYMIHNEEPGPEDYLEKLQRQGWEFGTHKFDNPLVMAFNTNNEAYYDENSWKAILSRKFGGFKGKALAKAIRGQGYDGIVTVRLNERGEPLYVSEIVDLTGIGKEAQKAMPLPETTYPIPPQDRREFKGVWVTDNMMRQETADQLNQQYGVPDYGGAGQIGIAYYTSPTEVVKITRDWREAKAASEVYKNPRDWIVPILEEPQMIQENPPLWKIRAGRVEPLYDDEFEIFLGELAYKYMYDDFFPDDTQLRWEIETDFDEELVDKYFKIAKQFQHILNENSQSLWLPDLHGGNVGIDPQDGRLKVLDLGPGLTHK